MAALIKVINSKIRANPVLTVLNAYVLSLRFDGLLSEFADTITQDRAKLSRRVLDFWGPVSNFGILVAAVMDTQKSPELCALIPAFMAIHSPSNH